jgi:hypothetical protein
MNSHATDGPERDALGDDPLLPRNSVLVVIDCQPSQVRP